VAQRNVTLALLVAGSSLLSACGGGSELPWSSSFASADQQFQIIRQAEAQQSGNTPAQARTTFDNMQGLWDRMGRAQSGMMRSMGGMHGGGMMGRFFGGAGRMGMPSQAATMQFNEMNQEMLSYCLGMQQMMNQSGHADMAAMYGQMADRMRAMLSRLPESAGPAAAAPSGSPAAPDGAATFASNCASCHGAAGEGISGVFPPLNGSEVVAGQPETIAKIVLQGLQGPVTVAGVGYNGLMPAFGGLLTDAQIAAVLTHVRSFSSNDGSAVTADAVEAVREATASRKQPWTLSELGLP
jgi:mono/diheme cytochrome c family protein